MKKRIARSLVKRFSERYDYDTTYMERMLEVAPEAFFKFAKIMPAAEHRRTAPKEAYHAVKIVAAMAEDCGPCTQLAVDMARESGVADDQIEAVLTGRTAAMSESTAAGFRFARSTVSRSLELERDRATVNELWGEAAVVELSLCLAISRVFPLTKTAMGYARECRQVKVSGHPVAVATG